MAADVVTGKWEKNIKYIHCLKHRVGFDDVCMLCTLTYDTETEDTLSSLYYVIIPLDLSTYFSLNET